MSSELPVLLQLPDFTRPPAIPSAPSFAAGHELAERYGAPATARDAVRRGEDRDPTSPVESRSAHGPKPNQARQPIPGPGPTPAADSAAVPLATAAPVPPVPPVPPPPAPLAAQATEEVVATATAPQFETNQPRSTAGDQQPTPADDTDPQPLVSLLVERLMAYRPGVPALLVLVLVTIAVAYTFRPQETPNRRRGSLEASDPRRLFDQDFDDQQPLPMSASTNPGRKPSRAWNVEPMAPERDVVEAPSSAPVGRPGQRDNETTAEPTDSVSPATDSGPPMSEPVLADRPRLAAAPSGLRVQLAADGHPQPEAVDRHEPPAEAAARKPLERANSADSDEEGPPPDISGRRYPETHPSTYLYRGDVPETREANRQGPSLGESR